MTCMRLFDQFRRNLFLGIVSILLVISLAGNIYLGYGAWVAAHPGQYAEKELKQLVADVGKVMVLPEDETPTTATVTDPEKLKDQPFFAHAQVGDKVLIYQKTNKAILWRPSTHKVIEVSNINPAVSSNASPAQ